MSLSRSESICWLVGFGALAASLGYVHYEMASTRQDVRRDLSAAENASSAANDAETAADGAESAAEDASSAASDARDAADDAKRAAEDARAAAEALQR